MNMKKIFAPFMAAAVFMLGTATVMAAPSTEVSVATNVTAVVETSEGFKVTVVEEKTVDSAKSAVKSVVAVNSTAELVSVVDISDSGAKKLDNGNYQVTVKLPAISAKDTVIVLHNVNDKWEEIKPSSVKDGSVTFESKSLSPFAFVTVSAKESPKTGETFPVAALVLVCGAAAAVICGKKYFA